MMFFKKYIKPLIVVTILLLLVAFWFKIMGDKNPLQSTKWGSNFIEDKVQGGNF